jgi:RimJ/RimL family protein N-acetyltransferase
MTRWLRPGRVTLTGRWVRLEPLGLQHADDLHAACVAGDAEAVAERFRFLPDEPPHDAGETTARVVRRAAEDDPLWSAIIDLASGRCIGQQALLRIEPAHGVVELGHILWGPDLARTRGATEAFHLCARHVFEDLGYRRLEWKCDARHARSRQAAVRFGFRYEGEFRQHMWRKGGNRDTAWYAMLDGEWPALGAEFRRWLAPDNFDATGQQLTRLATARD